MESKSNSKSVGYQADREPDASWHRPSTHKPAPPQKYDPPKPQVYNPNVEYREDYVPTDKNKPQGNIKCTAPRGMYYVRGNNVYDLNGKPINDPDIRRLCGLKN